MDTFFPTARESRLGARNNILIHNEIRDIEDAVLQATEAGYLEVQVFDTAMTDVTPSNSFPVSVSVINNDYTSIIVNGVNTGDIIKFNTTGTMPSPLSPTKYYYGAPNSTHVFKVYPTKIDAANMTNPIDILNSGTGSLIATRLSESQVYYGVYKGVITDRTLTDQMDTVIKYFSDLGYAIQRRTNPTTQNTFLWEVKW